LSCCDSLLFLTPASHLCTGAVRRPGTRASAPSIAAAAFAIASVLAAAANHLCVLDTLRRRLRDLRTTTTRLRAAAVTVRAACSSRCLLSTLCGLPLGRSACRRASQPAVQCIWLTCHPWPKPAFFCCRPLGRLCVRDWNRQLLQRSLFPQRQQQRLRMRYCPLLSLIKHCLNNNVEHEGKTACRNDELHLARLRKTVY